MRRLGTDIGGLVLAGTFMACIPARGAEEVKSLGSGPSYELIGKVAVMHEGRIKPLDTVAREEVKQVYGVETMKLADLREEVAKILDPEAAARKGASNWVLEKWGPVGAFLGWTVNPDNWDDKAFILVDYLPLRRLIMADERTARLKAIAAKPTTPADEKPQLEALANDEGITAAAITAFVRKSKLPAQDRQTIAELAVKLTEEHKRLTPRELDSARITVKGQPASFLEWASELQDQQRRFNANPQSAARLTEVERRAVEAASRLMTYKAYSGERLQSARPRPDHASPILPAVPLGYGASDQAGPREGHAGHAALEARRAQSCLDVLERRPARRPPRSHRGRRLRQALFQLAARQLGMGAAQVTAQVETRRAGRRRLFRRPAARFPRRLPRGRARRNQRPRAGQFRNGFEVRVGHARSGRSGQSDEIPHGCDDRARDTFQLNEPLLDGAVAYGAALALLAMSLGFVTVTGGKSFSQLLGSTIYRAGLGALVIGICLEVYGFFLRVQISGWAPVTNMYETVIWVALVAAVLSFVFELIYRKVFMALAGSAVALLGTITAANVPLLDPSIKGLQPVLRSNLWLTIHVLTEVSSYAAFGLAWGLGLIATLYYLTATYRRSPRFRELALLLDPGRAASGSRRPWVLPRRTECSARSGRSPMHKRVHQRPRAMATRFSTSVHSWDWWEGWSR